MRTTTWRLLVAVWLGVGTTAIAADRKPEPQPADPTGDIKGLQGKWMLDSVQVGNKESYPEDEIKEMKTVTGVVKGDRLTFTLPGQTRERVLVIVADETQSPRSVDVFPLDKEGKKATQEVNRLGADRKYAVIKLPVVFKFIYKLDGETLTVAAGDDTDHYRPTELKASAAQPCTEYDGATATGRKDKQPVAVFVLKRVK